MRQAHSSQSPGSAEARHTGALFGAACLALLIGAGCSLDERTLLTTSAIDGSSAAGGQPAQMDSPAAGALGEAGEAPLPRCLYLGNTVEKGCETLVQNAGFTLNVADWVAEDVGVSEGWLDVDATGSANSGSLVVTNSNYKDDEDAKGGTAGGGARQCIPVASSMVYDLAADVFIPDGQSSGFDGNYTSVATLSIFFYPDAKCAEQTIGNFTSDALDSPNEWLHVEGSTQAPKDSQAMAVRLATLKPFRQYSFEAYFDNVFVRERPTP
jgi:hypothetical protein